MLEEHGGLDRISDTGFNILQLSDSSDERQSALREAAKRPALFRQVLEHYKDGLPSDVNLRDHLVRVHKFNPESVATFIKAFRETVELAKLSSIEDNSGETSDRREMEEQQGARQGREMGARASDAGKSTAMQTVFLMRLKDGTVVELRASGDLANEHAPAIKNLVDMALGSKS